MLKNKRYAYSQSGFTLIELLVVIAVVGILSAIVIASLGSARIKNNDNAVKSALNQARIQADLFYTTNNTYAGVCSALSDNLPNRGIYGMVLSAAKINGLSSVTINGTGTISTATCNTNALNWAAEVPLKGTEGVWCVDSSRKGGINTTSIGAGVACP